ncbi:MAG TPA: efflux RND transporter permease subunit, partial [bacterium]|nr:efflux RND transporter permease subunit [bacterium]
DITFPVVGIMTDYTGVGPEDIENTVSRPLESAVVSVENINNITSWSKSGSSTLLLEFEWGTDMDQAEIDVRKQIDFVRDMLPEGATDPMTFAFNPSMQPIMFMFVSSEKLGTAELKELVDEQITPRFERVEGVASAYSSGGLTRQIKVMLDPEKLAAHGVSSNNILRTIGMENLQIPGGLIDDQHSEFAVRTYGDYQNVDQIKNTVIGSNQGEPIYLKNVANVIDGYREKTEVLRNNGQNAIMIIIQKQTDANTVRTVANIDDEIPKIESGIGKGIKFDTLWDQADFIKKSLSNLTNTGIQAFILAFLVILFFLRHVRSSIIASISIPISIVITFFVLQQAGLTLNIISMAGLALAIGMLIDNSIVVLENIFRHKEKNKDIRVAANEGTTEVGMAIIASTLTTLAIFVPILFVPGIAGVMFNDMVVAIVGSLSVSLLVALTLIPLLSSRLLGKDIKSNSKFLTRIDTSIGNFLDNMERKYVQILDYFLSHKLIFFGGLVLLIIATVIITPQLGGEFMPKTDQGNLEITVERETSASLTSTNKTFEKLESIIREEVPEAENIESSFGIQEGWAAMFGSGSNQGDLMVTLPDVSDRDRTVFEIQDTLRKRFENVPGAEIRFQQGGMMMGGEGDIEIKIFGHDRATARSIGDEVARRIEKIGNVVDINKSYSMPKPEYQVRINRDRVSALGLNVNQVATAVEVAVKGKVATRYREGGDEYDVMVRYKEGARQNKKDLNNIYLTSMTGQQIPLKNVADIVIGEADSQIDRENQERMVAITCSVSDNDLQGAMNKIEKEMAQIDFPRDFRWEVGGSAEDMQESFKWLGIAILAAAFLVYMVMASQFESLLDPFIIIFTVPLAIIGALWGLYLTGTSLSVTALIGMVLLVGIVVNNGIVLVDYINQLREKHGYNLWMAILSGGKRRMRPILMTALTTILAMIPIALKLGSGAELWVGMARAVIGGLVLATILTLVLIPIIYLVLRKSLLNGLLKNTRLKCDQLEDRKILISVKLSNTCLHIDTKKAPI